MRVTQLKIGEGGQRLQCKSGGRHRVLDLVVRFDSCRTINILDDLP